MPLCSNQNQQSNSSIIIPPMMVKSATPLNCIKYHRFRQQQ
ncbi:hypothetical protein DERF_004710 [Dermatophagoides farinae]|uniref:Uncharacterized protein n=1 Tax=Dermatophagoides farinae TaxID=6954 RepID=A0A922I5J2_DERFA|nr:hypothetical protein DERF_004710 [Dermatophagoides farinae]